MIKQGSAYLDDFWNYLDMSHISIGYLNIFMQWQYGIMSPWTRFVAIMVCLISLAKTFFFLRVIQSFSPIVTMIMTCIYDLRIFMSFFFIMVMMLSTIMSVISSNPASEYRNLSKDSANFLTMFRISLGDFDFGILSGDTLSTEQQWLYWILWMFIVIFTALIFMNFIIAEVSNSYAVVKESVTQLVNKDRAGLIGEAEDMLGEAAKANQTKFPKFIVQRVIEE
jgi:hypothetical protein